MAAPISHLESTRKELGTGIYSLAELRAFLAFSGTPEDAQRALPWLMHVLNPVAHKSRRPDYSFSDLISLFVVRELRRKGVRTRTIRAAEAYLRRKWRTDRPFVSDEIQTDGHGVYVEDELIAGQIESADRHGQQVMREMVKDRLSHVHYHEGSAAYWVPAPNILVDPRVQFGEPVVAGTRVPTNAVGEIARRIGVQDAAAQLGITVRQARSADSFERGLAKVSA
jgi:uncharacterized protein (DUF433 family)/GNAT superfamily N-acetyltransferase